MNSAKQQTRTKLPFEYDLGNYRDYCNHQETQGLKPYKYNSGVLAWSIATQESYSDVAERLLHCYQTWTSKSWSKEAKRYKHISVDDMFKYRISKDVHKMYGTTIGWSRTSLNQIGLETKIHLCHELLLITDQPLVAQLSSDVMVAVVDGVIRGSERHADRKTNRLVYSIWTKLPVVPRNLIDLKIQDILTTLADKSVLVPDHDTSSSLHRVMTSNPHQLRLWRCSKMMAGCSTQEVQCLIYQWHL